MKCGIKKLKQKVEKGVTLEIEKLHMRDAFQPVRMEDILEN